MVFDGAKGPLHLYLKDFCYREEAFIVDDCAKIVLVNQLGDPQEVKQYILATTLDGLSKLGSLEPDVDGNGPPT